MATRKKKREKIAIHSLSLTDDTADILARVVQDAKDYTGRTVSGSSVVRALLRYTAAQGYQWEKSDLFPLIETELTTGLIWGKEAAKKKS
jgi:hypothetical protein